MPRLLEAVAFDHVGIAAAEHSSGLTRLLGVAAVGARTMPSGVAVGRFGPGAALELVQPARPGSPVERFLARRGPGLHHLALRVDEPLSELLPKLAAAGFPIIGGVEPSSDRRPSVFIHPDGTGGVLVELVEGPARGG
jgi:methylmalonyl-CoA/ethylmalonyl-CoA epimerase